MNLKTHKIIVSIALTLVLCTGAALLAQALFQAFTGDVAGTVTVTPPADGNAVYVSVATEAELIKATKDEIYNSPESISDDAKRVIILLTEDITLNSDLLITRDCHIDLGGKTLDTNGYQVTVFHTYTGAFVISNGNLTSNKTVSVDNQTSTVNGSLVINTRNAAVLLDTTVTVTNMDTPVIKAISEAEVCQAVLSMVCAHLSNNLDNGIYGTLGAACTLPSYTREYGCTHTETVNGQEIEVGCCFVAGTADLPYWFFGYEDLSITYEWGDASYAITGSATAGECDSLTATVVYGQTEKEFVFHVHQVTGNEANKAAAAVVLKSLDSYYVETDQNYNFSTPILLPSYVNLGGANIATSYKKVVIEEGLEKEIALEGTLYSPDTDGSKLKINDEIIVDTVGEILEFQDTEYTIANRIIKELFGSAIVIEKLPNGQYTTQSLAYSAEDLSSGATNISFSLVNNLNGHYDIKTENGEDILYVTSGSAPEEYQGVENVYLQAIVTVKGNNVAINIPVKCELASDNTNQVNEFLPYYHYFNQLFSELSEGGYTYKDFSIPAQYSSGSPKIKFFWVDVANGYQFKEISENDANDYLTIEYDSANQEWDFTINPENIGQVDQDWVLGYGYTFQDVSVTDNSNLTYFSATEGTTPGVDNGIYSGSDTGHYTHLTIPGVLSRADCPDKVLYEKLYGIYHLEDDTYSAYEADGITLKADADYILFSRLSRTVNQNQLNFANNSTIRTFKGIEFLSGATGINLDGALAYATSNTYTQIAGWLAQMTNLEYLNLANNDIKDGNGGFGPTTDVIAPLTTLTKLKEIHLENNVIYDFSSLTDFPALEKAYVYGNLPEYSSNGFLGALLGDFLTGIIQNIYGSTGSANLATFAVLDARGADVYNENATTPFTPSQDTTDTYTALASVEYQDKVVEGADISMIFNAMNTAPEAYGIAKKGPQTLPTYEGNTRKTGILFENKISFRLPYQYGQDGKIQTDANGDPIYVDGKVADHFYLVYTDYTTTVVTQSGIGGWLGGEETVGFSYDIEIKMPITRVDENGNPIVETPTT